MLTGEAADQLVTNWQRQVAQIATRANAAKEQAWRSLGSWNSADVSRFDDLVREIDAVARQATVTTSEAFYSTYMETPTAGLSASDIRTVRPDPRDPFTTTWRQLKNGAEFVDALESGVGTINGTGSKHVANVSRETGDLWAERSGARVAWERRLTGVSCEWCALVSTQTYRSAASATFGHDTCDCLIIPTEPRGYEQNVRRSGVIDQDLADTLDRQGVQGRVAAQQAAGRSDRAADNAARRRDEVLERMRTETDPDKVQILESRARRWDREAQRFRSRAAEERGAARPPRTTTGYVTPDGTPAPRP